MIVLGFDFSPRSCFAKKNRKKTLFENTKILYKNTKIQKDYMKMIQNWLLNGFLDFRYYLSSTIGTTHSIAFHVETSWIVFFKQFCESFQSFQSELF